ncbi:hypothetical protein M8J76_005912 [Diaphorina citri]|nr:hypothetical protein M8J75_009171 [Diaphorina citri]KAI5713810.1 hypothetical protein M8J76_005912 [Diaphorina citri]
MQEETSTTITKDSGYSTSCNSQSQKSASFKSKSSNSASSGESSASYRNDNARQESANKETGNLDKIKSTRRHKKKKKMSTSTENLCSHNEQSTPMDTNEQTTSEKANEKLSISEPITEENETESKSYMNKPKPEPPPVSPPSVSVVDEKEVVQNVVETDPTPTNSKEFNAIVSMKDGVVLYCTSNLTDVLGFPADMWLGRSFIDFVHPNDRSTFASYVASCITTPDDEEQSRQQGTSVSNVLFPTNKNKTKKNSVYCCLRHYKSLVKGGYGITERRVNYIPCQLIFNFKEIPVELSDSGIQQGMFLIITARAVHSIYKVPDEKIVNCDKVFIKHNNLCQISYVNDEILPKFGYLPHRTLGRSIFNFYHPEDLPYIKKIYSDLLKDNSNSKQKITSKPIRFRCQNGCFATVETEWSTFINPWTGKLEFITGHHSVIQGPHQPDVCTIVEVHEPYMLSDDKLKHSKTIQDEIHLMLDKPVIEHVAESKSKISHEPKGLSSFMESLIKNTITPNRPNDFKIEVAPTENISERDSVMLGEISPHHEYSDGKSSSETPPSYNQLNYDDNIQRFFESKPKTSPSHSKSDETNKTSDNMKSESSETSGDSESFSKDAGAAGSRKHSIYHQKLKLTEESLIKHNADMEKKMVQKHKEQKYNIKYKNKQLHQEDSSGTHGVKRSGSHSWENEPFKSAKQSHGHHHGDATSRNYSGDCTTRTSRHPNTSTCVSTSINLWPPFNVSMNPLISTTNTITASTLVPYLYIPNETSKPGNLPGTPSMPGIPYVSPFVYPLPLPMYSPMLPFYSPLPLNNLQSQPLSSTPQTSRAPDVPPNQPSSSNNANDNVVSSIDNSFTGDESSYQSSMYSLLRTDESSPEEDNTKTVKKPVPPKKPTLDQNLKLGIVRKFPVGNEQLQYQLTERKLNDVLSKDLLALNKLNQPDMVNVQLSQLYSELELEGIRRLKFEDGFTSSDGFESFGNTSSDENSSGKPPPVKKKIVNYDNLSRLFEENAPMPPPEVGTSSTSEEIVPPAVVATRC